MKVFSVLGDCTLRRVHHACPGALVPQECLIQVQKSRSPGPQGTWTSQGKWRRSLGGCRSTQPRSEPSLHGL